MRSSEGRRFARFSPRHSRISSGVLFCESDWTLSQFRRFAEGADVGGFAPYAGVVGADRFADFVDYVVVGHREGDGACDVTS